MIFREAQISAGFVLLTQYERNLFMKKTSIFLLIIAVSLLLFSLCVQAEAKTVSYSGTFDGYWGDTFQWKLYSDGELCISGNGILTANPRGTASGSNYPWYTHRSKVTSITVEEGITAVGLAAFEYSYATAVSLPESITSIGSYAFRGTNLTSVRTPANLKSISSYAFISCKKLTSVNLPNVTSIGQSAFEGCTALKEITLVATSLDKDAFYNCNQMHTVNFAKVPSSINTAAFSQCSKLKNVNFVGTQTQWNKLINGNSILTGATVNYVTALNFDANGGGYNIMPVLAPTNSTIIIPDNAPLRNGYTFRGWASYKYDTIVEYSVGDEFILSAASTLYAVWETPEGVIAKGTHPSTDMSWILYDDGHLVINGTGSVYGDNSSDTEGYKHYRTKIKTVTVNEGITGIGNRAFYNFPITSISLPSTLTAIGNNAFSYTSLKTITLPSSVSTIGGGMLMGSKMEIIHLGNPSHNIEGIFTNCTDTDYLDFITVDENNALYTTVDGVLYNKDMTILIRVPATRSGQFVVPDTVIGISQYAFSDTANLESLVLPVSLASIGDRVFNSGESPIIYYKGTEAQWQNVTISTVWNNIVPSEYEYGKTYSITFDAKGGTGAPAADEKMKGFSYTLPEVIPQKAGYAFLGWATDAKANVAQYQSGDAYTEDCDTVFYAVWELIEATVEYNPTSRLWMFNVSVEGNPDGKSAYVAIYDQYDNYLSCDSFPIVNGASELMIAKDSLAKTAKVFVLDDSSVAPYTKSVTIPLN